MLLTLLKFLKVQSDHTHAGRRRGQTPHRRPPPRSRLSVEQLEGRDLPSSIPISIPPDIHRDSLYIGDSSDNTVKRFDAATGIYEGVFVSSGSGGLLGPRGLIFGNHDSLLAVNQNAGTTIPGELLRYDGDSGAFVNKIVGASDPHAPYQPRGMVLAKDRILFVADLGNLGIGPQPGRLAQFDAKTGTFLGDLAPTGFTGEFNPRGVVFGPHHELFVSVRNLAATGGHILRFDPLTQTFLGDFVDSNATNDMNRPEGIAFGPDGNLYVASFRADAHDTDKVLEFNGQTGAYLGKIDTDQVGQPRAFGQALLFGPDGKLFVPISGLGPDTGEVRRYDVVTKTFDVFVPPSAQGGPLGQPWYLTFGDTDPMTLAYKGPSDGLGAAPAAEAPQGTIQPQIVPNALVTGNLAALPATPPQGSAPVLPIGSASRAAEPAMLSTPLLVIQTSAADAGTQSPPAPAHHGAVRDAVFADLVSDLYQTAVL